MENLLSAVEYCSFSASTTIMSWRIPASDGLIGKFNLAKKLAISPLAGLPKVAAISDANANAMGLTTLAAEFSFLFGRRTEQSLPSCHLPFFSPLS